MIRLDGPVLLAGAAAMLWGLLLLSPLRPALEGAMATHMAVQIPLLFVTGAMMAPLLRRHEPAWLAGINRWGVPGIVLAAFAHLFWMIPRSLDAALADPGMELAKFVSLPLLAGLPFGLSWHRLPALGRGFVAAMLISMLGALGSLYLAAPARLCAYYRIDQQTAAGWALIAIAAALFLVSFAVAFAGSPWPAKAEAPTPIRAAAE
jgi:hypothetical protein